MDDKNPEEAQMIDEYLRRWHKTVLTDEARRQSVLASAQITDDEEFREQFADSRPPVVD
jgi:hypothetical protein